MTIRKVEDLIEGYLERFKPLDQYVVETETKWDLDMAYGVYLDQIASVFPIFRQGADDDTFRRRIKALAVINNCTGTFESVIDSIKFLFNAEQVTLHNHGMGTFTVEISGSNIDEWALDYVDEIPAAGIRISEFYITNPNSFRHDIGPGLDVGQMP